MQVKANDMTGVPKELQTWNGMQARMDPDRARAAERKKKRAENTVNWMATRKANLDALRELRIDLAARATKAGSQVVRAVPRQPECQCVSCSLLSRPSHLHR